MARIWQSLSEWAGRETAVANFRCFFKTIFPYPWPQLIKHDVMFVKSFVHLYKAVDKDGVLY